MCDGPGALAAGNLGQRRLGEEEVKIILITQQRHVGLGLVHSLLEVLGRGRLVEEEVAAIDLVRALPAHDHLEASSLDLPRQQVHWHGCSHLQSTCILVAAALPSLALSP